MINKLKSKFGTFSLILGLCYLVGNVGEMLFKSLDIYWLGFMFALLHLFSLWFIKYVIAFYLVTIIINWSIKLVKEV